MAFKVPNKAKSEEIVDEINDKFVGIKPKPLFSIFNLKIEKDLHKKFKIYCAKHNLLMREVVCEIIREKIKE